MKNYAKNQYSGNINGWGDNFKTLSVHKMNDDQAAELNSHFGSTGVKYEETDIEPHEFGSEAAPKDEAKPADAPAKKSPAKKAAAAPKA
jgi:hypothetical protein